MKQFLAIIIMVIAIFGGKVFGQQKNYDERLLEGFSVEEIKNMDDETLAFNTYCIENAFQIEEISDIKFANSTGLVGAIPEAVVAKKNFFSLPVELKNNEQRFLILGNQNRFLIIKSLEQIQNEVSEH